eukprot:scaffold90816_cov63-Phaeocystis_antarctica.AAC.4
MSNTGYLTADLPQSQCLVIMLVITTVLPRLTTHTTPLLTSLSHYRPLPLGLPTPHSPLAVCLCVTTVDFRSPHTTLCLCLEI